MPKVNKSKARTDRYITGLRIPADTKKGYKIDKSKPADKDDTLFCKKGDTYYYWAFAFSPVQYSRITPRNSQLTKSEFYSTFYSIEEEVQDSCADNIEDLESLLAGIKEQCEELRDLQEEKRDNMISGNENLEYTPTCELLQERYDTMDDVCNSLDSIFIDEDEIDDLDDEEVAQIREDRIIEYCDEKIEEIVDSLSEMSC